MEYLRSHPLTAAYVRYEAKYLGSKVTCYGNNVAERQQRIHGMKRGYAEMGAFWHTCKDMQALRQVFVAKVVSQATSGLAAFPWTQTDSNVIEGVLCHLFWKLCRKRFLAKDEDSNVVCSYTSRELMGVFGIARHFTEVRVQRLLMMQAWARSPIDFAQPISVVFGPWTVQEMNEFGPDGRPCKTCSNSDRWTQQVIEDMRSLCDIEGGRDLFELVDFRFAFLLSGNDQHTHTHTHTWWRVS